jgi:hypothetical protein
MQNVKPRAENREQHEKRGSQFTDLNIGREKLVR